MSAPIDKQTALQCMQEYEIHPKALPAEAGGILKGIRFDKDHVEDILNHNSTVELFCAFGVRPEDLGKPSNEQFFTIILAGIDGNNDLHLSKAYEYGFPCPSNCPTVV